MVDISWLRKKITPSGKVVTEKIKMDLTEALEEAEKILVSEKQGPVFTKEREIVEKLLKKIDDISVKKAQWALAMARLLEELKKHEELTIKLTDKFTEFEKAFNEELAVKSSAKGAMTAQQAAQMGELEETRKETFAIFATVFSKVRALRDEFMDFKKKAGKVLVEITDQRNAAEELVSTLDKTWSVYQGLVHRLNKTEKALNKAVADAEEKFAELKKRAA